jgi:hypothetical protein
VNERVSLTCEALVSNARCWSITRESGDGPICWWDPNDVMGSPCWSRSLKPLPRAYLVVKVALSAVDALVTRRWKVVAISVLEPETLSVTVQHIVPWLERLPLTRDSCIRRGVEVRDFFSLLSAGMFSLDVGCTCTGISVCLACCRVNRNNRRFLTQGRFQGECPRGRDHWFYGMTDAVGDIAHGQEMWLSCSCGPYVQECVVS